MVTNINKLFQILANVNKYYQMLTKIKTPEYENFNIAIQKTRETSWG